LVDVVNLYKATVPTAPASSVAVLANWRVFPPLPALVLVRGIRRKLPDLELAALNTALKRANIMKLLRKTNF
jgi:hypothetical protein